MTGYRKQPRHQGVFYRKAYCRLLVYVYVCVTGRRIFGQRPSCNNPTREQRGGHRNSDIQFGAKARGFARPASLSQNPMCVRCSASHASAGDERGPGGVTVVPELLRPRRASCSALTQVKRGGGDNTRNHHHHHHHRSLTRILTTAPSTSPSTNDIEHRVPAVAPPTCSTGVRHRQTAVRRREPE